MRTWLCSLAAASVLLVMPPRLAAQPQDSAAQRAEANARKFVQHLIAGEFEQAGTVLDATMARVSGPPQLKELWAALARQHGAFQRVGPPTVTAVPPHFSVVFPATWAQGALDIRLVMDAEGQVSGLWLDPPKATYAAPSYVAGDRFRAEDVTIGVEPWLLPGTLLLPKTTSKVPAVVLVHGSGPNDRDEHVGNCWPFRDIAEGLASRGVAVLRYDKRTLVHGAKMVQTTGCDTLEVETIDDACMALEFLRQRPEIDARRVCLLGHSLGATFAPVIGERDRKLAGLILLAPLARDIEDVLRYQFGYLARLAGTTPEADPQTKESLAALDKLVARQFPPDERVMGASARYWYNFMERDGRVNIETARKLDCPILILHGGRDYQVTNEDFAAWTTALADRPSVTCRDFAALNHLFIAGTGPGTPAEYQQPGHVAVEVIDALADWLEHARSAGPA